MIIFAILLAIALLLAIVAITRMLNEERQWARAAGNDDNMSGPARHVFYVGADLIAIVVLVFLFSGCGGSTAVTKIEVRERIDTLIVRGDTIRILNAVSDTILVQATPDGTFRSVAARLDTTLQGVRLSASYQYPPDDWQVNIIGKDTIIRWTVRDSIIREPYAVTEVPIWTYFVLGLAIIVVLRSFFK